MMDQGILEGAAVFGMWSTKLLPREKIDRKRSVDPTLGSGRIRQEGDGALDGIGVLRCRFRHCPVM